MIQITLSQLPNQKFSVRLSNSRYDVTIKETRGVMSATIDRNGVRVCENQRIVAGRGIIPYRYQEDGNFALTSENEEIPYWTAFGVTQFLYYFSQMELNDLRTD